MQQSYVQNEQFNQYAQQPQYGIPPAPTADQQQQYNAQQQYAQPIPPPSQQQRTNQSNTVQIPNQPCSQQPIIITQGGGKKKRRKTSALDVLLYLLAAILIVGIIALAVMSYKEKTEQAQANKAAEEATKNDEEIKKTDIQLQYKQQNIDNNSAAQNLNTINTAQDKSQSL